MKNILGQELKVGDAVMYVEQKYNIARKGIIIGFKEGWGEMVPLVSSFSKRSKYWHESGNITYSLHSYSRWLSSCNLCFPIDMSYDQIKAEYEQKLKNGEWF